MGYQSDHEDGDFDLYAASLDNPETVVPEFHAHDGERLPWIALADTLPRHTKGSSD